MPLNVACWNYNVHTISILDEAAEGREREHERVTEGGEHSLATFARRFSLNSIVGSFNGRWKWIQMQKPRRYLGLALDWPATFFFTHLRNSVVLLVFALIFALNSIIKFYGFPRKSSLVKLYCTFARSFGRPLAYSLEHWTVHIE